MLKINNILLDPLPPAGGGGMGHPSGAVGTVNLNKSALDETDHNKESDPVDSTGDNNAFDINEIVADKRVDQTAKLPSNQISKNATRTKQVFKMEEPAAKPADENDDPNATPPEVADANKEPADEPKTDKKVKVKESEEVSEDKEGEKQIEKSDEADGDKLPRSRNYDGLDAEDVKVLKGSNNYHYKKFRPLLDKYVNKAKEAETFKAEAETLKKTLTEKGVPPTWYEHPQAFTLTPEFNELQDHYDKLTAEREFYEAQLVNVKSGKPFVEIKGYDKTTGQPQLTEPREGTHADDVKLNSLIQRYGAVEEQTKARVAAMQATFHQTMKGAEQAVDQSMDAHINALIPELRPVKEEMDTFVKVLPAPFKDRVPTRVAAKLYSICNRQAAELAKYKDKEKNKAKIAADNEAAGPNTKTLSRNGTSQSDKTINGAKTVKLSNGKVVPASFDIKELVGDSD